MNTNIFDFVTLTLEFDFSKKKKLNIADNFRTVSEWALIFHKYFKGQDLSVDTNNCELDLELVLFFWLR